MQPTAIDPPGCGCTECLIGEYVPLDEATAFHVRLMLRGMMHDNTGMEFTYRDGVISCYGKSWALTGG